MTRPLLYGLTRPGPHLSATTTPLVDTPIMSQPKGSGSSTEERESVMTSNLVVTTRVRQDSPAFQCRKSPQKLRKCCRTPHLEWLSAVATVTEPITRGRLCTELGWRDFEAKRSLGELSARGYLVATPGGHFWTEAARQELNPGRQSA